MGSNNGSAFDSGILFMSSDLCHHIKKLSSEKILRGEERRGEEKSSMRNWGEGRRLQVQGGSEHSVRLEGRGKRVRVWCKSE